MPPWALHLRPNRDGFKSPPPPSTPGPKIPKMSGNSSVRDAIELTRNGVHSPSDNVKISIIRDSCSLASFQDSGYSESLKTSSFDCTDVEFIENTTGGLSLLPKYHKNSGLDVTHPGDPPSECDKNRIISSNRKVGPVTEFCETPKGARKNISLRRRLFIPKTASSGNLGHFDVQKSSLEDSIKKQSIRQVLSFEENILRNVSDSPGAKSFTPLATSTLKTEEAISNCQKLRYTFSQQKTSTVDDSKSDSNLFETECISPISRNTCQGSMPDDTHEFGDGTVDFNDENVNPEHLTTPAYGTQSKTNRDTFVTPITQLVANLKLHLCNPKSPAVAIATPEESDFHSLGSDKSQDSFSGHESSQELQKHKGTPKVLETKRKQRNLVRVPRLSTLRERGSQSETEEDNRTLISLGATVKSSGASVIPDSELVLKENNGDLFLCLKDLSKTPALQFVHQLFMKTKRRRSQQNSALGFLEDTVEGEIPDVGYILAGLIGKKMGLEKLDILTELKFRNLKHILAVVLDALTVESLCSVWRVSRNWREIVIQDKKANWRRKYYITHLKWKTDAGCHRPRVEDATTRLAALNRSALRPVQIQARTPFTCQEIPPVTGQVNLTSSGGSSTPQMTSRQEEYVKVARTLLNDEALKPCPRCQCPAKYQPVNKRGLCSREACAFDFCVLCLRTYHGSEDCRGRSGRRRNKKDVLPGSDQSRHNLKRL
ncbi:F-box only protein 43 [Tachyglossus aculeatus]|uniref:F-box only protein 43 n=1 Tax=Tachyglossus aculeatus TaxID=9261 RepID=UPI0018F2C7C7|nr:F-box only protein 43 [Tachyglossus aculeatus]